MGKHASLGICVLGNNKLGEKHTPATPGLTAGKQVVDEIQVNLENFKNHYTSKD